MHAEEPNFGGSIEISQISEALEKLGKAGSISPKALLNFPVILYCSEATRRATLRSAGAPPTNEQRADAAYEALLEAIGQFEDPQDQFLAALALAVTARIGDLEVRFEGLRVAERLKRIRHEKLGVTQGAYYDVREGLIDAVARRIHSGHATQDASQYPGHEVVLLYVRQLTYDVALFRRLCQLLVAVLRVDAKWDDIASIPTRAHSRSTIRTRFAQSIVELALTGAYCLEPVPGLLRPHVEAYLPPGVAAALERNHVEIFRRLGLETKRFWPVHLEVFKSPSGAILPRRQLITGVNERVQIMFYWSPAELIDLLTTCVSACTVMEGHLSVYATTDQERHLNQFALDLSADYYDLNPFTDPVFVVTDSRAHDGLATGDDVPSKHYLNSLFFEPDALHHIAEFDKA